MLYVSVDQNGMSVRLMEPRRISAAQLQRDIDSLVELERRCDAEGSPQAARIVRRAACRLIAERQHAEWIETQEEVRKWLTSNGRS